LLNDRVSVEECLLHYRRYYAEQGMFEAKVYPGISDALRILRDGQTRMFVCTSKPTLFAQKIVEHFELRRYFDGVYGAALDDRFDDKAELAAHMRELEGFHPETACMIGDRHHDVDAAKRNGIPAIGVLWGYGSPQELETAGALALCSSTGELARVTNAVTGNTGA
jgi:phosphoglycolate phosphatase